MPLPPLTSSSRSGRALGQREAALGGRQAHDQARPGLRHQVRRHEAAALRLDRQLEPARRPPVGRAGQREAAGVAHPVDLDA